MLPTCIRILSNVIFDCPMYVTVTELKMCVKVIKNWWLAFTKLNSDYILLDLLEKMNTSITTNHFFKLIQVKQLLIKTNCAVKGRLGSLSCAICCELRGIIHIVTLNTYRPIVADERCNHLQDIMVKLLLQISIISIPNVTRNAIDCHLVLALDCEPQVPYLKVQNYPSTARMVDK